jgi:hypothetical protein
MSSGGDDPLVQELFQSGLDLRDPNVARDLLEQYKLFVQTSETLVARRQTANSFFFSLASALLGAIGVISHQATFASFVDWLGVSLLGFTGLPVCLAWRRLIQSYRQLNQGKFSVINLLEEKLPAALFKAEWMALGEGKDPKRYKPFVSSELWIPDLFFGLFLLVGIIALGGLCYRVMQTLCI